MNSNLYLVIKREFLERVRRKSFIITTILMPILMLGLMAAPALAMLLTGPESKSIAVIDYSGEIAPTLQNIGDITFSDIDPLTPAEEVKADEQYDAVLIIGSDVIDAPDNVTLYTRGAPSIQTEMFVSTQIEDAISNKRMQKYEIDNLDEILSDLNVNVQMSTYRIDKEEEQETSSTLSYILGMVMSMMLYMFIMIYGQMVMNSIIEEKNNRVLEIVVSSVRPRILMLGKIIGIGLVALTQILIWGVLIVSASKWLVPFFSSAGTGEMAAVLGQLSDTGYILSIVVYAMLFLAGGYLFYSSIYAAIGSAVDNVQDASQLTIIATVPIILGIVFSMSIINDPNSSLAFWLSVIPFTSPIVMMARLPFGIPGWETWLSLAVLTAGFLFMIWLGAKIYRVGIFMYGKKPSLAEIIKWARYK